MRLASVVFAFAATSGIATKANAQQGFALDRYDPAARGSDWFALESLDLRGTLRPAAGLTLDWAHKPLVLYDASGKEFTALVQNQLFLHLGGALTMWNRVRFGASIPIALVDSGNTGGTNLPAPNSAHFGDIRLDADVRIFGVYGAPLTLAGGLQVFLPTGSQSGYTSDGSVRLAPRVMAAGKMGWFEYAAKLSIDVRLIHVPFDGTPLGSEMHLAFAAGARLMRGALIVGPELSFGTGISQSAAFFQRRTTPVELLVGAHYTFLRDFRAGFAIGPGLSRGLGTPAMRVLGSIDWAPAAKQAVAKSDRDHDAVPDDEDACPDEKGIDTGDPGTNGCPAIRVDVRQIHILEQIKFETGSAKILPQSDRILAAVAKALSDSGNIKLRIEGHTDNRGGAGYNKNLSERRAASVVEWLTDHGVSASRLSSVGFGDEKPIDSNSSERGRYNNRRVEFHIVE